MKTKLAIFIWVVVHCYSATCQNLEHEYENIDFSFDATEGFGVIEFEQLGKCYFHIHNTDSTNNVRIFDLQHNQIINMELDSLPSISHRSTNYLFFSQYLFDNDDGIEFLYESGYSTTSGTYAGIYNVDGTLIKSFPGMGILGHIRTEAIFNTPSGTKLMLEKPSENKIAIYSLPGKLLNGRILDNNISFERKSRFSVCPNPSQEKIGVDLSTFSTEPPFSSGVIDVFDINGNKVKSIPVSDGTKTLQFENVIEKDGVYLYRFMTKDGKIIGNEKNVKMGK